MIKSDYHIHSEFSGDSNEKIENIINRAKKLGMEEIAITDHLDLDTNNNSQLFIFDLDRYVETLLNFKEKYKKELKIKIGMEFGIQKHLVEKAKEIEEKYPFDFIISSIHSIDRILIDRPEFWENLTMKEGHEKYLENVFKCAKYNEAFSVFGHLDFISRYGGVDKKGVIGYIAYKDIIDEILKTLIDKGKGIEINTSGIRYKENRFYPADEILKRYKELGGEILTVGSDSHKAEDIGKNFQDVEKKLESLGIKYISSFDEMEVSFKKIK